MTRPEDQPDWAERLEEVCPWHAGVAETCLWCALIREARRCKALKGLLDQCREDTRTVKKHYPVVCDERDAALARVKAQDHRREADTDLVERIKDERDDARAEACDLGAEALELEARLRHMRVERDDLLREVQAQADTTLLMLGQAVAERDAALAEVERLKAGPRPYIDWAEIERVKARCEHGISNRVGCAGCGRFL